MTLVLVERLENIAIVRLNNPGRLNSLSGEMCRSLSEELTALSSDETLRALVLTAEGRAFSSGTDINQFVDCSEDEAHRISERGQLLCELIEKFPVPVVAAINGIAAGGGCELAFACHLRVASMTASFSMPETKLGLIPGYRATQKLRREVGLSRAYELMLTGRSLSAAEAEQLGVVNRVVNESEVLSESLSLAREIAKRAPLAIRACLKAVNLGLYMPLEEGLALERQLFASLFTTEDVREGTAAFLEKRAASFKGK